MRFSIAAVLALGSVLASCASSAGGRYGQSPEEVRQVLASMMPTTRLVVDAKVDQLDLAARGYMERAFPLSAEDSTPKTAPKGGPLVFESETIEWFADGMPHRTRVRVDVYQDPIVAKHRRVEVRAQLIEPEFQLADARAGQPLGVMWKLSGSNPKVEELILQQIMNRYLALVENRPINEASEWLVPTEAPKVESIK